MPLFLYSNPDSSEDLFSDQEGEKSYAISDRTLASYVKRYGKTVNKEMIFYYIYGLLNCPDYINNFSTELRKGLPRIPQVNNFFELAEIGLALGDLHVNYETLKGFELQGMAEFRESRQSFEKVKFDRKSGNADTSRLIINDSFIVSEIPDEVHAYQLGGRSALDWFMDRYEVKTEKQSGIQQNPNMYSENPDYVSNLLSQVIEVSIEHHEIVKKFPKLAF